MWIKTVFRVQRAIEELAACCKVEVVFHCILKGEADKAAGIIQIAVIAKSAAN